MLQKMRERWRQVGYRLETDTFESPWRALWRRAAITCLRPFYRLGFYDVGEGAVLSSGRWTWNAARVQRARRELERRGVDRAAFSRGYAEGLDAEIETSRRERRVAFALGQEDGCRQERARLAGLLAGQQGGGAWREVLAERMKQRARWSAEHDDGHDMAEFPRQAAALALASHPAVGPALSLTVPLLDIWHLVTKHGRRERVVVAAALLLAELERLDRRGGSGDSGAPSRSPADGSERVVETIRSGAEKLRRKLAGEPPTETAEEKAARRERLHHPWCASHLDRRPCTCRDRKPSVLEALEIGGKIIPVDKAHVDRALAFCAGRFVCNLCTAPFDASAPAWTQAFDVWAHRCTPFTLSFGLAVRCPEPAAPREAAP